LAYSGCIVRYKCYFCDVKMKRLAIIFSVFFFLSNKAVVMAQATDDKPYVLAAQMPQFPGGSDAMIEFIQEHLEYPMAEKKAGIQGTIMMQFIVEKDGSLSDIKAIKTVDKGENLVKEATRVINLMPKWKPGVQDGQNVRVYKNVPFYFILAPKKQTNTTQASTAAPHK
jgi:protein TonB